MSQEFNNELFEKANSELLAIIPDDQLDHVFSYSMCEIDPEFLGFINIYKNLAELIPFHWTVVDLGCAYAPQAFLFKDHAVYIGVDSSNCNRFSAQNTQHFKISIKDYIAQYGPALPLKTTFAICSYVPPWGGDNQKMAREFFPNVFTYYPAGGERLVPASQLDQLRHATSQGE